MTLRQPLHALALSCTLAFGVMSDASAAPAACFLAPEELGKALGRKFDPGVEEPGIGGTSCKYSSARHERHDRAVSVWLLTLPPGPSQDMLRQMTAGGPKASFEPVAGDPDGAARVRGGQDDQLADITYRRAGHVVFLRALRADSEPDAKARNARRAELEAALLKLRRVP
jgi:hypothetical protein